MAPLFLIVLLACRGLASSAGEPTAVMRRVLLDDAFSTAVNARCLDGTRPAYYIRKASSSANSSKFIVYFQGGGWCYTLSDCASRATGALGSSSSYPPAAASKGGIVDPDPARNPNFHDWNLVWVPYCDGTSWSGNQAKQVPVGGGNTTTMLWYRGRANMQALVAALSRDQGMGAASDVLIDGGSAGGLTTLLHADFFRSQLPSSSTTIRFAAIGDAGWFRPEITLDHKDYTKSMAIMHQVSNATTNAGCMAHYAGKDPAACVFAPNVFPFLTSKMFILEGRYDSWQLANILGFPCASYWQRLNKCSRAQNATLEAYGSAMAASVNQALASTAHHQRTAGAFVSQCIIHVQSAYNENHDVWHGGLTVGGATPHDTVSAWYFNQDGPPGEKTRQIEDCGLFGCNAFCQSYTF